MSTVTTLGVTGMTCSNCVSHVTKEVTEVPGVEEVSIRLDSDGVSQVAIFSDEPLDEAALREAVDEAGYEVASVRVQSDALAAETAAQSKEKQKAHSCSCGCGGTGGGAGPTYNRNQGTYSLSVPPK